MRTLNPIPLTALAVIVSVGALVAQGGGGRGGGGAPPGGVQGPGRGGAGGGGGRAGGAQPPRDAAAQAAVGTASITGLVVVEGGGTPVRRARVNLSGVELRSGRSVFTDDQGRFTFVALPAGRFTMTASKAGYVDNTYGAKRAGRPGTQIQLADGQKLERAVINLPKGGVITGVVLDEHGEPAAGTQVRALRYVIRTGERTLQQSGQDTADDRGVYRIFQLQPGEYVVNALPRNMSVGDLRQTIVQELSSVAQQLQASGINAGQGFNIGAGGNIDAAALASAAAGRGGPIADRLAQLQQQLAGVDQEQAVAYAPVYYPGTTEASSAASITLGVSDERTSVDFRLQLVPTSRVGGIVTSPSSALPTGTQVALVPAERAGMPSIPGLTNNVTRVGPDGRFTFNNVTPGQYQLQARATIRDQAAGAGNAAPPAGGPLGGRGGPGGPGAITQVLWAMSPLDVGAQSPPETVLNLQPGMTVGGRTVFPATASDADPTRIRVSLTPRGGQTFEIGAALAPVQPDEGGRFSIVGVAPGRYMVSATMAGQARGQAVGPRGQGPAATPVGRAGGPGGAGGATNQWFLESAIVDGRDVLDFPLEIGPNQNVTSLQLSFTATRQELSGTIQDGLGRPTSDFTIIVFPPDTRYWVPQARRIASARPGTDGRFTFSSLPAGDYRLTAVTDVEPGEWYDPAFLTQLNAVSLPVSIGPGEKKVQDIRLAQ